MNRGEGAHGSAPFLHMSHSPRRSRLHGIGRSKSLRDVGQEAALSLDPAPTRPSDAPLRRSAWQSVMSYVSTTTTRDARSSLVRKLELRPYDPSDSTTYPEFIELVRCGAQDARVAERLINNKRVPAS